jgi:hypothetical protein
MCTIVNGGLAHLADPPSIQLGRRCPTILMKVQGPEVNGYIDNYFGC